MTGSLEIRYLSVAEKDIDEIFEYVLKDNRSAAVALLEEFDLAISRLSSSPELGVIPKDERLNKLGYRILIIRKYLVFYVVKGGYIQIRRIIHGARQYQSLF